MARTQGSPKADGLERIFASLIKAEIAEKHARSIRYQLGIAKLPLAKEIEEFVFKGTPINAELVKDLAGGGFLAHQRNVVLIGGTGSGWSHLAIGITRNCIRGGAKARYVVDLVNKLEAESKLGRQGRIADRLARVNLLVLDELGYLPFAQSGGQLLFHLISRLYERTSIIVTTNLAFADWANPVRRQQDDDSTPRPADPPLRHHRDWQRQLALQEPEVAATLARSRRLR